MSSAARFQSFSEFYPYYSSEHAKPVTRALHVAGTSLFVLQAGAAVALRRAPLVLSGIVSAYGLAWIGHFFVEHNRPATFKYPLWSLMGDFRMCFNILTGREALDLGPKAAKAA